MGRKCEDCKFYEPGKSIFGKCHRYPPIYRDPLVVESDWCGEWSMKQKGEVIKNGKVLE